MAERKQGEIAPRLIFRPAGRGVETKNANGMIHAIYAVRTFLEDCKDLARHGKVTHMIHFTYEELPLIYEEMVKGQRRIEELEEKLKLLEELK